MVLEEKMQIESQDIIEETYLNSLGANRSHPYYLFEKSGEMFVYILACNRFSRIDKVTHDLLKISLVEPVDTAKNLLLERGLYTKDQIEESISGVEWFMSTGLMNVPVSDFCEDCIESELKQRHAIPWDKIELALSSKGNWENGKYNCHFNSDNSQGLMRCNSAKRVLEWFFAVTGLRKELNITLMGSDFHLNQDVFRFVVDYGQRLAREHGKKIRYSVMVDEESLDEVTFSYINLFSFNLIVNLTNPAVFRDGHCGIHLVGDDYGKVLTNSFRTLLPFQKAVTVPSDPVSVRSRISKLVQDFERLDFTQIVLGQANSSQNCPATSSLDLERREEEELITWMLEELVRGREPRFFAFDKFIFTQENEMLPLQLSTCRCGAGVSKIAVGSDGNFYPCHRYVGMNQFCIGHIDEGPNLEKASEFWRAYNRTIQEKCGNCWAQQLCSRPCPWEISSADGTFLPPEDGRCDSIRRSLERMAYVHYRFQKEFPIEYEDYVARISCVGESRYS
jgi:uncharacterized protein